MNRQLSGRTRGRLAAVAAVALTALVATACSSASAPTAAPQASSGNTAATAGCSKSATPITFWGWVPGFDKVVSEFNQTHPSICVTLQNVGSGTVEYNKLLLDIRGHKGLPDVAEVEYSALPELEITNSLANLNQYGAQSVKSEFSPGFWSLVSHDGGVYAIPGDAGPMGLYVNTTFMSRYHLAVPTTWAQLASEATALHKAHPNVYLTNFSAVNTEGYDALLWQAGARPFTWSGTSATFSYNSAAANKVASYWQGLIDTHSVDTLAFGPALFKAMNTNTVGIGVFPAWGPSYFSATAAKATLGKWASAALPQWVAGAHVTSDWGGSSYAVFKSSAHPQAAATFVMWMNATLTSWKHLSQAPSSLFPAYEPMLSSSLLAQTTIPLSGTRKYFVPFAESATQIAPGWSWSPFEIYGTTQMDDAMQKVVTGSMTIEQAMSGLQNTMDSYAKSQGFSPGH